ncbi:hypothetical protein Pcinc_011111 [Petrolisthes cinctipes]|uniref:Uncharacterized protein n=1 Tax=Petrolisthes cinctipes TaxID=88211 RepID=A0AAE1G7K3_PETCI|nr:hypothetical protein Pcinc_011111 [Petrolisthes cinctipes]
MRVNCHEFVSNSEVRGRHLEETRQCSGAVSVARCSHPRTTVSHSSSTGSPPLTQHHLPISLPRTSQPCSPMVLSSALLKSIISGNRVGLDVCVVLW